MFANQFKRIARVKLRIFILKWLTEALIYPFYERNAMTRANLTYGTVPGAPCSYKTFLVFTCIWQENIAKIPKIQRPNTM